MSLSLELENLSPESHVVDIVLPFFPSGIETWNHAFTFPFESPDWADCFARGYYPFETDLKENPVACHWGTRALGWGNERGLNLFLPIVSVMESVGTSGTVFFWDNCTSWKFIAEPDNVRIQRRFYLSGKEGFVDAAMDVGDGEILVPHRLYIGYTPKVHWPVLYNDFYLDALPSYTFSRDDLKEPLIPGLFGGHEAFFTQSPWTEENAHLQAHAGVRYASLWFGHANHPRLIKQYNMDRIDWAHKYGLLPTFTSTSHGRPTAVHTIRRIIFQRKRIGSKTA
ncbi:TPA: hypothetical protein EYN98_00650 [Candidatus Poribacteria bacterium]|nr:hypothetical protein [Candidatus Poribacteria bacterium]HIA64587.1 hypothetical protein [Candidatus Poribacteria bacterium]HIB99368.1 hypothetical protein [Candidatus Poribacteria bacterium]HIN27539.1 hypothetical protein [Candidatus Poribacteria bacterium]